MTGRSPGEPLTPGQLPGVSEALPVPYLVVVSTPTRGVNLGYGYGGMVSTIAVERASYRSHDIPFQPLRENREP